MNLTELLQIVYNFYPPNIDLNDNKLLSDDLFSNLIEKCEIFQNNQGQWNAFLQQIEKSCEIEITQFVLLKKFNPSFIAVFLTQSFTYPKTSDYQPLQLIIKISVIAPVYILYFDNLVSETNKRLFRSNPLTSNETNVYNKIREYMLKYYKDYSLLDISMLFYMMPELGNISLINKRKPYLDECIFGLYLSIHPHNILVDGFGN